MKTNLWQQARSWTATVLIVCGPFGALAVPVTPLEISRFDSNLSAFCPTNFWYAGEPPTPSDVGWTNFGMPAGSMRVVLDWQPIEPFTWQDARLVCDGLPNVMLNLRDYAYLEFDAMVCTDVSETNSVGDYGMIHVVAQDWGWPPYTNVDIGHHALGSVQLRATCPPIIVPG